MPTRCLIAVPKAKAATIFQKQVKGSEPQNKKRWQLVPPLDKTIVPIAKIKDIGKRNALIEVNQRAEKCQLP